MVLYSTGTAYCRFSSGYFPFFFLLPACWNAIGYRVCCLVSNIEKSTRHFAAVSLMTETDTTKISIAVLS